MKRLKLITKFFLKNALQDMFGKSKLNPWLTGLLVLFCVFVLSAPFAGIVAVTYDILAAVGQEGSILTMLSFAGAAITFIFGIYIILNVFYFSNDVEPILPLPFKSSEIVFGKFLAALLEMYMYSAVIILPLITYGISSKAGVLYYVYAFISVLISPVLAMILAGIVCMIIMRFTSLSKHKDGFRIFAGVLMLVAIVAFNVFTNRSNSNDQDVANIIAQGNNSAMGTASNIFITNKFAAYAMLYSNEVKGLLFLLAAVIISAAAFGIYYIVGGQLYLKGIIGVSETFSKRENVLEGKKAEKAIKRTSPVMSLVFKDLKIMLRTPQFFMNSIAMIFYMPAIMGVGFFSGGKVDGIKEFFTENTGNYGYLYLGVFVLSTIAISAGGAAMTAVSREGKDFFVSKYIPIDINELIKSKIISSLMVNGISALICIIIMIIIGLPIIAIGLSALISVASVAGISFVQLFLDYRSPNISWDNEKDIFKKNFLPLIMLLLVIVIAVGIGFLTFVLKNQIIIFMILMAINIAIIAIMYPQIKKVAIKTYMQD
ncbi:MAG: hypothetical protein PUE01_06900 [Clostridiaceae bacterium]|nr:hypothetical protein [Clostridiaceae bacterium]